MKEGKGGVEVNESLSTRIQFLHIWEFESEKILDALLVMKYYQLSSNQLER